MEGEELIDLLENIYLLATFKYSEYQICNNSFNTFCQRIQLVKKPPAILSIHMQSIWNAKADFFQFICNNREWFRKDRHFSINNDIQCRKAGINLE